MNSIIAEPHCYGIEKHSRNEILRGYQIGGLSESASLPFWRNFKVAEIVSLRRTENLYGATRPGYNPSDSRMSIIFARAQR